MGNDIRGIIMVGVFFAIYLLAAWVAEHANKKRAEREKLNAVEW